MSNFSGSHQVEAPSFIFVYLIDAETILLLYDCRQSSSLPMFTLTLALDYRLLSALGKTTVGVNDLASSKSIKA